MDNHDFARTSERENQLLEKNRNLEAQQQRTESVRWSDPIKFEKDII